MAAAGDQEACSSILKNRVSLLTVHLARRALCYADEDGATGTPAAQKRVAAGGDSTSPTEGRVGVKRSRASQQNTAGRKRSGSQARSSSTVNRGGAGQGQARRRDRGQPAVGSKASSTQSQPAEGAEHGGSSGARSVAQPPAQERHDGRPRRSAAKAALASWQWMQKGPILGACMPEWPAELHSYSMVLWVLRAQRHSAS